MAGSGSDFIKCTVSLPFLPLCKSFAFIPKNVWNGWEHGRYLA